MSTALLGEFESAETMLQALRALKGARHNTLATYTPFDMPEVDSTLGLRRSRVGWSALLGGVAGFTVSYLVQWWTAVHSYPVNTGGRPINAAPAFLLITFETTVLFAALAAFIALAVKLKVPRLWAPEDEVAGFERATIDRFWIRVDQEGSSELLMGADRIMQQCGALRVVALGEG